MRYISSTIETMNSHLRDLSSAAEKGCIRNQSLGLQLTLLRRHFLDQIWKAGEHHPDPFEGFDPRIRNLTSNVICGEFKTFNRRIQRLNLARSRQRQLLSRHMRGEIDRYADVEDDDGVVLMEAGKLTTLNLRDFESDRDERNYELWRSARGVTREVKR